MKNSRNPVQPDECSRGGLFSKSGRLAGSATNVMEGIDHPSVVAGKKFAEGVLGIELATIGASISE